MEQISLLETFWKSFTFLVTLLLQQKVFKRDFWEVSILTKCLQSLGIEPIIRVYIYNIVSHNIVYSLWFAVGKSSFLHNILEEIRPGCRNLQESLIMIILPEAFLGGILKVQSGVWVWKYGLVKIFCRYKGREVVIG